MWILAIFDFPRHHKPGRLGMQRFTKELEKEGFCKLQRGLYARYCPTRKNGLMHQSRITKHIEPRSTVCLINISDKDFADSYSHYGSSKPPKIWPKPQESIQFF